MDVKKVRALQYVRRFNFERCNRYQSVAEHAHFVALLAMEASSRLWWPAERQATVLAAATLHDLEEAVTGDLPFLVKRALPVGEVLRLEARAMEELGARAPHDLELDDLLNLCDILEL